MANITKDEIEKIAILARIELNNLEKEKFSKELSSILSFVEKLQEVDTADIVPISQVTGLENVLEEDNMEDCPPREDLLRNTPEKDNGFIKVKKVFE